MTSNSLGKFYAKILAILFVVMSSFTVLAILLGEVFTPLLVLPVFALGFGAAIGCVLAYQNNTRRPTPWDTDPDVAGILLLTAAMGLANLMHFPPTLLTFVSIALALCLAPIGLYLSYKLLALKPAEARAAMQERQERQEKEEAKYRNENLRRRTTQNMRAQ